VSSPCNRPPVGETPCLEKGKQESLMEVMAVVKPLSLRRQESSIAMAGVCGPTERLLLLYCFSPCQYRALGSVEGAFVGKGKSMGQDWWLPGPSTRLDLHGDTLGGRLFPNVGGRTAVLVVRSGEVWLHNASAPFSKSFQGHSHDMRNEIATSKRAIWRR
jgi:hypothetical protein